MEELLAQIATLFDNRFSVSIYGNGLDNVDALQFEPHGPSTAYDVTITSIDSNVNESGTAPFSITLGNDIYVTGTGFNNVFYMQFEQHGPITSPPGYWAVGSWAPPWMLTSLFDYILVDDSNIVIPASTIQNLITNNILLVGYWYQLVLHCNEVVIPPTTDPTGISTPVPGLTPPSYLLESNQTIRVPSVVTNDLLDNTGELLYETWYQTDLTYTYTLNDARAINPQQGWNWDPAAIIAPNILATRVSDDFTAATAYWAYTSINNGSISYADVGATLSAGPVVNSASTLTCNTVYPQGDWTLEFSINRQGSADLLDALFTYVSLSYTLDDTVINVSRVYSPDTGHAYTADIVTPTGTFTGLIATNAWLGALRIIRYQQSVTLLARDFGQTKWQTVSYSRSIRSDGDGVVSISTHNDSITQIASVVLRLYELNPGVMLGEEPVVYTYLSPSNIDLYIQPQIIDTTRFVNVITYTPTTILLETIDGFEYVRPNRFSLGGTPNVGWWLYQDVPTAPGIDQDYTQLDAGTKLLSMSMTPMYGQYNINQTVQYRIIASYNDGTKKNVTSQCSFSTTDVYCTIGRNGMISFGYVPGLYYITATYQGMTQTAIGKTTAYAIYANVAELTTDPNHYIRTRFAGLGNLYKYDMPLPSMIQTSYPSDRAPGPPTYPIQIPNFITPDLVSTTFGGTYGMYVGLSFDTPYDGIIPVITLDGGSPLPGRHSTDPFTEPCYITNSIVTGTAWSFVAIWLGNHTVGEADPINIFITYNGDSYYVPWRQIPLVQSCDVTGYTYDGTWMIGGVVELTGRNLLGTTISAPSPYIDVSTPSSWVIPSLATNTALYQSRTSVAQQPPVQLYSFAARYNHGIGNTGIKIYSEAYQWSPAVTPIPVPPYGTIEKTVRISQTSQLSGGVPPSPIGLSRMSQTVSLLKGSVRGIVPSIVVSTL